MKSDQVENMFDTAAVAAGGKCFDKEIGNHVPGKRADYIFSEDAVFAELKCLDEDIIHSDTAINKASKIYVEAIGQKKAKVIGFGTVQITSRDVDDDVARKLNSIYREPLRNIFKDTSKQIRGSKEIVGFSEYKGLLLIANNNHSALDPSQAYAMLNEILNSTENYRGINSVIYLTAGMPVVMESTRQDASVWIECHRNSEKYPRISQHLLDRLRVAWCAELSKHLKRPVEDISRLEASQLADLRNEKPA